MALSVGNGFYRRQGKSGTKYKGTMTAARKARKRARIFERDGHRCLRCDSPHNLTLDHVVPAALGGGNEDANLQTLCERCNELKGDRSFSYLPPEPALAAGNGGTA